MATKKVLKEIWLDDDIDFFREFSPTGKYSFLFSGYLFRGEHSELFKKLLPTSLRENSKSINNLYGYAGIDMNDSHPQHQFESFYQTAELNVLKNFYVNSNFNGLLLPDVPLFRRYSLDPIMSIDILRNEIGDIWLPNTVLEIAALAQHYGLPTRMIDWSRDIYTSMYFASSGAYIKMTPNIWYCTP
ncbi:FRG domain-containing protein [Paenibacillus cellulosilyticus]|uniref:FRG domain-containing protein n=1 Tax=Paenibacillus cellulosilyticus TaxID=375489 RepID=A0A2V2YEH6_9BACL|nr:FRG domain-containing protein [Paenibacillus cellulosilyticus]PWV91001.1 FRG domain-containing protein [Paenibacillus cellulosilyticus]QKS45214.1 FRG domain-containing protein [Paenibacillus cellulosilyticus]